MVEAVYVMADGPRGTVLEQRAIGEDREEQGEWRPICELPCEATIVPYPRARHRIVDHANVTPLTIRGSAGERVVINFVPGATNARRALLTAGVVVTAIGAIIFNIGLITFLREGDSGGTAPALFAGLGTMAAGGGLALTGFVVGQSRATVTHTTRVPEWTAPSAPRIAGPYIGLLDLRF